MADQPVMSFGEELKRERLVREISLDEISAATKISMRLLTALEASDLSKLPAPTFTRGFIRAYALHLGIEPEEKVNAYLADLAGGAPDAPSATKRVRPRSRFWRGRRATAGTIVGGVTGVLLLLGLIASPERRPSPPRERAAARSAPVVLKNVMISSEPTPVLHLEAAPSAAPRANARAAEPAGSAAAPAPGVSLLLEFDGDSWTKLEADGRTVLSGLIRRGESRRFEARDGFRLTLGDAGAVRVTVDGHALDRLGGAGEVVRDLALPGSPARG